MNCNNCHSTWETPESIVVTHCPFCQKKLQNVYPVDSIERKLIEIVNANSHEIYNDNIKFLSILNDKFNNTFELINLIKAIIPNNASNEIYKLKNSPDENLNINYSKTIEIISNKTFISKDVLLPAVNLLCIGLGIDLESINPKDNGTPFEDFKIENGQLIKYIGNDKNVVIPNSVTTIGHGAFEECTNLTGVAIPDSVIDIGHGVFAHCTNLTRIIIPDTITSIGDNIFAHCTNLRIITLPKEVTSIGYRAFYYCTSLTEIIIPKTVTYIGLGAFYQCYNLNQTTKNDIRAINSDAVDVGKYIIK